MTTENHSRKYFFAVLGAGLLVLLLIVALPPEMDTQKSPQNIGASTGSPYQNTDSVFTAALTEYRRAHYLIAVQLFDSVETQSPFHEQARNYMDSSTYRLALQFARSNDDSTAIFHLGLIEASSPLSRNVQALTYRLKELSASAAIQTEFHRSHREYYQQYLLAGSALHKEGIVRDAVGYSIRFFNRYRNAVHDWRGRVTSLGTTSVGTEIGEGSVYITIESDMGGFKIRYGTFDNGVDDLAAASLIGYKSKVYNQLKDIKLGDRVIFSADIITKENLSITGATSLSDLFISRPELILRFTDIQPLIPPGLL